jgi:hypothetical protein
MWISTAAVTSTSTTDTSTSFRREDQISTPPVWASPKKEKKESNDLVAGWHPAGMLDRESCSLFAAIQEEKAFQSNSKGRQAKYYDLPGLWWSYDGDDCINY